MRLLHPRLPLLLLQAPLSAALLVPAQLVMVVAQHLEVVTGGGCDPLVMRKGLWWWWWCCCCCCW
jgi:hypothetical protein